jgi:hypothetical protein
MHGDIYFVNIHNNVVITHLFNTAGEDAIMAQVELIKHKVEMKLLECVNDTQLNQCGLLRANLNKLMI